MPGRAGLHNKGQKEPSSTQEQSECPWLCKLEYETKICANKACGRTNTIVHCEQYALHSDCLRKIVTFFSAIKLWELFRANYTAINSQ